MSDVKGCATDTTDATASSSSSTKDSKRDRKRGFLRGVLDGWRSSVHAREALESPSHSTSCGQLTASSSKDTDSLTESVQDDSRVRIGLDLRSDSEEKMRTTPSPAPGLLGVPSLGSEATSSSSPSLITAGTTSQVVVPVKPGFLYQPTAIAFDPVQRLVAIANRTGHLRIMRLPLSSSSSISDCIDCHARHPSPASAVIQLQFIINEGTLISLCADDFVHLWNYKVKQPEIIHSLKFQRERLTVMHLPFQSKWLYIGTERGNVHVANIDSFQLSGYVINWNKAIELSQRSHPGSVVHLSDCPIDPNKLLIGYETGLITFWDLRNRSADFRITYHEALTCISWHHEGRQFLASHPDGSFTTWELKAPKPVSVLYPHARTITDDLKIEPCRPITKIDLKTCRSDDPFTVFTGGLPYGSSLEASQSNPPSPTNATAGTSFTHPPLTSVHPASASASIHSSNEALHMTPPNTSSSTPPQTATPTASTGGIITAQNSSSSSTQVKANHHDFTLGPKSLSIIHGKATTVLEMKHNIVDFVTLCETPYDCDFNEPFAVLVLLSRDLMLIDLQGKHNDYSDEMSASSDGPKYSVTSILPESDPDMIGSPFVAKEMPEPPKQGFFKGLFSGAPSILDREELFGEQMSGKASRTVAKQIPGSNFDQAKVQTGSLAAELMKARQGLTERGENLERLEDRTARMAAESEGFRDLSHQLLNKYKDKKWYQF